MAAKVKKIYTQIWDKYKCINMFQIYSGSKLLVQNLSGLSCQFQPVNNNFGVL